MPGSDASIVESQGRWTRRFLVWARLLDYDMEVLGPPEMVADARAVAGRLAGPTL